MQAIAAVVSDAVLSQTWILEAVAKTDPALTEG
jgi:hypothetical protein